MLEREREKWELHRGRWQGPSHRQCFSGHWRMSYFYFNLVEMGNKRFWSRDWHEQKDCSGHRVELNWVSWRQKAVLRGGYGRELSAVNSTPDPRPSPQALMTDGNDGLHPPVPTGFQFRWYWWEALVQEEQSGRDTLFLQPRQQRGGSYLLPGKPLQVSLFSKADCWAQRHSGFPEISNGQDSFKVGSYYS